MVLRKYKRYKLVHCANCERLFKIVDKRKHYCPECKIASTSWQEK